MSEEQKPSMFDYIKASDSIYIPNPLLFSETEEQKEYRIKTTDELAIYYMEQRIEKENRDKIKKEQERQEMKDLIKEAVREVLNENNTN